MASLTREDWEKVWESIKKIERATGRLPARWSVEPQQKIIYKEVEFLKTQVQEVIGQME